MRKFRQLHYDDKKSDCWRTALACVLEIHPKRIPNFGYKYPENQDWFYQSLDYVLARYNKMLVGLSPGKYKGEYIGIKSSPKYKHSHALIYKNGKLIWNPNGEDGRWGRLIWCVKLINFHEFIDKKFKPKSLLLR